MTGMMAPHAHDQPRPNPGRPLDFLLYGAPKSGTTWLRGMLSDHPHVHCAELRPFGGVYRHHTQDEWDVSLDRLADRWCWMNELPHLAEGELHRALMQNALCALAETFRDATGKALIGDKHTPVAGTGKRVLESALAHNPSLAVIHLVRDPRDTVVSGLVHVAQLERATPEIASGRREAAQSGRVPDEMVDFAAEQWRSANRGFEMVRDTLPRSITVRYEDLLRDPPGTLARVLDTIGVEHDPGTLRRITHDHSFERLSGGRTNGVEDRKSFFRKGVAGDWVNWLTDRQASTVERAAGDLLERYRYLPADTSRSVPA